MRRSNGVVRRVEKRDAEAPFVVQFSSDIEQYNGGRDERERSDVPAIPPPTAPPPISPLVPMNLLPRS